ncbi:MAG: 4-hydroxy-tetrahydrodipicolinate synthase [Fluviibacter sp.]|jgi:4-hydroxy-tetrahydrodipicolinate synthase|nr:4-hydroxy-tetrahydrodipicolinate synthase [Rhodocyclales bacterium]
MITGSIVAIVTPMQEDGSLDLEAFRNLVDFHIREKTDAIVVVGTTGESPTVDVDEHCQLIEIAVAHSAGRIPIIAGTGANSTKEAIYLTQRAKDAGADAGLSVVPYYNKPSQEGLYQHYRSIAEAVPLPLILYNVPGRTVADMSNDTILRLAQVPGIIGVKDATGNLDRAWDLIERAPKDFALYSGDDMTCMATILMGYHGNISVTANIAPRAMHDMCAAAAAGNAAEAVRINRPLIGLHRHLFCEANPIPVKWAVAEMGLMSHGLRLPLTQLAPAFHERVRAAMKQAGL